MFRGLEERQAFMDHYMETLLSGYNHENTLPGEAFEQLPLFIRLIQVEELLHFVQYIDTPDPEIQARLRYKIKCIEDQIPFMGFFDPIYNASTPFALD
jgi:Ser/Thr protein kinase RdoA (MazF antagonist)